MYMVAKALGLDRDDRLELARILLWRDIESWRHLSDEQVDRILDALEGYVLIAHIRSHHPVA